MSVRTPDNNQIIEKNSISKDKNSSKMDSENLLRVKQMHEILENSQSLTKAQKLDYCNSQRQLIKLYLKEIANKKKKNKINNNI